MISRKEFGQNTGEQLDLARGTNERIVDVATRVNIVFDALEQKRVLADLAQLHQLIAQALDTTRFA